MKVLLFFVLLSASLHAQLWPFPGPGSKAAGGGGGGTNIRAVSGNFAWSCGNDNGTVLTLPVPATVGNVLKVATASYNTSSPSSAVTTGSATTSFSIEGSWAPGTGNKFNFQKYVVTAPGITGVTIGGFSTYNCRWLIELQNADTGTIDQIDTTGTADAANTWVGNSLTPTTGKSSLILGIVFGAFTAKSCGAGFDDLAMTDNASATIYGALCGKYVVTPNTSYHVEGPTPGGSTWETFSEAAKGTN